jgi:hypothetical protein
MTRKRTPIRRNFKQRITPEAVMLAVTQARRHSPVAASKRSESFWLK